jgi:peroxiredoxin
MQHRFVLRACRTRSMSLKAQLEACRRAFEATGDPTLVTAVKASIRRLSESGLARDAVKAGDVAPPFRLRDGRSGFVTLSDLLARGPAVLSFFRGEWCSYCALEFTALSEAAPEIRSLGASLIALSPRARLSSRGSHGNPSFPTLRDPGGRIAGRYRIVFTLPRQFRAAYLALGFPKPAKARANAWRLPIPATYVVDRTGLVVLSYLDPDHTTRLDPTEIIGALRRLQTSSVNHSRPE